MPNRTVTRIRIDYSDGSYEFADGDAAHQIMHWYFDAEVILLNQGGIYCGPRLKRIPPPEKTDLDSGIVSSGMFQE